MDLQTLREQHALPGHLDIIDGPGEMPVISIRTDKAMAKIALHGAHVFHYQPHDSQPVLWLSNSAVYQHGKALRGGIPVCWPWFSDQLPKPGLPAHGFVRNRLWDIESTALLDSGEVQLRLFIKDDENSRELWPHAFEARLIVTLGTTLKVALHLMNTDEQAWESTGALHSYFQVGDIGQCQVEGLDGRDFLDKNSGFERRRQEGDIDIGQEIDRVYVDTGDTCIIDDADLKRRIKIAKRGSLTTVVWNPWQEKAVAMSDFDDDGYRQMLCVETACASGDWIRLSPGESHTIETHISVDA